MEELIQVCREETRTTTTRTISNYNSWIEAQNGMLTCGADKCTSWKQVVHCTAAVCYHQEGRQKNPKYVWISFLIRRVVGWASDRARDRSVSARHCMEQSSEFSQLPSFIPSLWYSIVNSRHHHHHLDAIQQLQGDQTMCSGYKLAFG